MRLAAATLAALLLWQGGDVLVRIARFWENEYLVWDALQHQGTYALIAFTALVFIRVYPPMALCISAIVTMGLAIDVIQYGVDWSNSFELAHVARLLLFGLAVILIGVSYLTSRNEGALPKRNKPSSIWSFLASLTLFVAFTWEFGDVALRMFQTPSSVSPLLELRAGPAFVLCALLLLPRLTWVSLFLCILVGSVLVANSYSDGLMLADWNDWQPFGVALLLILSAILILAHLWSIQRRSQISQ